MRFTMLLHHVTVEHLTDAFYALTRKATPGVDEVTWQSYEAGLESNLRDLHRRVSGLADPLETHAGAGRRPHRSGCFDRRATAKTDRGGLRCVESGGNPVGSLAAGSRF